MADQRSAPAQRLPTVDSLAVVKHRTFVDTRGVLVPIELAAAVCFPIVRLFWVRDVPAGTARGGHAHKLASQYLICVSGLVGVDVDDTVRSRRLELTIGDGLLIPPTIFATETYLTPDATLLVLCDRPYEVEDYIHETDDLRRHREAVSAGP